MQPSGSSTIATSSPLPGKLHHIGFVVGSIAKSVQPFIDSLQLEWDGLVFHDPNQGVRVTFLRHKAVDSPLLELVEPAGEASPVAAFGKKGGGLHHICYEVENLEERLAFVRSKGGVVARPPMPAIAFQDRRIAWVYTKSKMLIEFLERQR